jgi:hypothetical protein
MNIPPLVPIAQLSPNQYTLPPIPIPHSYHQYAIATLASTITRLYTQSYQISLPGRGFSGTKFLTPGYNSPSSTLYIGTSTGSPASSIIGDGFRSAKARFNNQLHNIDTLLSGGGGGGGGGGDGGDGDDAGKNIGNNSGNVKNYQQYDLPQPIIPLHQDNKEPDFFASLFIPFQYSIKIF